MFFSPLPKQTCSSGSLPLNRVRKGFLIPSEYSAADTWRLLEWCRELGADEFSIDYRSIDAVVVGKVWADFDAAVRGFYRGKNSRERMSGRTVDDLRRHTDLWQLNDQTISALQRALPSGLLQYDPQEDAWFEDPVFYRDGEMMLGVLSHEAFGVLRLGDAEVSLLSAAGFPTHDSLPRISDTPTEN
jgi:hypothetical protein